MDNKRLLPSLDTTNTNTTQFNNIKTIPVPNYGVQSVNAYCPSPPSTVISPRSSSRRRSQISQPLQSQPISQSQSQTIHGWMHGIQSINLYLAALPHSGITQQPHKPKPQCIPVKSTKVRQSSKVAITGPHWLWQPRKINLAEINTKRRIDQKYRELMKRLAIAHGIDVFDSVAMRNLIKNEIPYNRFDVDQQITNEQIKDSKHTAHHRKNKHDPISSLHNSSSSDFNDQAFIEQRWSDAVAKLDVQLKHQQRHQKQSSIAQPHSHSPSPSYEPVPPVTLQIPSSVRHSYSQSPRRISPVRFHPIINTQSIIDAPSAIVQEEQPDDILGYAGSNAQIDNPQSPKSNNKLSEQTTFSPHRSRHTRSASGSRIRGSSAINNHVRSIIRHHGKKWESASPLTHVWYKRLSLSTTSPISSRRRREETKSAPYRRTSQKSQVFDHLENGITTIVSKDNSMHIAHVTKKEVDYDLDNSIFNDDENDQDLLVDEQTLKLASEPLEFNDLTEEKIRSDLGMSLTPPPVSEDDKQAEEAIKAMLSRDKINLIMAHQEKELSALKEKLLATRNENKEIVENVKQRAAQIDKSRHFRAKSVLRDYIRGEMSPEPDGIYSPRNARIYSLMSASSRLGSPRASNNARSSVTSPVAKRSETQSSHYQPLTEQSFANAPISEQENVSGEIDSSLQTNERNAIAAELSEKLDQIQNYAGNQHENDQIQTSTDSSRPRPLRRGRSFSFTFPSDTPVFTDIISSQSNTAPASPAHRFTESTSTPPTQRGAKADVRGRSVSMFISSNSHLSTKKSPGAPIRLPSIAHHPPLRNGRLAKRHSMKIELERQASIVKEMLINTIQRDSIALAAQTRTSQYDTDRAEEETKFRQQRKELEAEYRSLEEYKKRSKRDGLSPVSSLNANLRGKVMDAISDLWQEVQQEDVFTRIQAAHNDLEIKEQQLQSDKEINNNNSNNNNNNNLFNPLSPTAAMIAPPMDLNDDSNTSTALNVNMSWLLEPDPDDTEEEKAVLKELWSVREPNDNEAKKRSQLIEQEIKQSLKFGDAIELAQRLWRGRITRKWYKTNIHLLQQQCQQRKQIKRDQQLIANYHYDPLQILEEEENKQQIETSQQGVSRNSSVDIKEEMSANQNKSHSPEQCYHHIDDVLDNEAFDFQFDDDDCSLLPDAGVGLTAEERAVLIARIRVTAVLNAQDCHLLEQAQDELFLTGEGLEALVLSGGGLKGCISALRSLNRINWHGTSYDQLSQAVYNWSTKRRAKNRFPDLSSANDPLDQIEQTNDEHTGNTRLCLLYSTNYRPRTPQ